MLISHIKKFLLSPVYVRHCSQTIYQALLGCLRMLESEGANACWRIRAEKLVKILISIQRPDGGFDIGYEFNYGYVHKRGQSTSPELVALVALVRYCRSVGSSESLNDSIEKAAQWISRHSMLDNVEEKASIPYCPEASSSVVNYNAVSFATAALAYYLNYQERNEPSLMKVYEGFINYLNNAMSPSHISGRYWHYSDQADRCLSQRQRSKIDYYHMMQQVEMHSMAQCEISNDTQLRMIEDACDHIVHIQREQGVVPYVPDASFFQGNIHVWGYVSVASGLLESSRLLPRKAENYRECARQVLQWVCEHAWNGSYFYPVLDRKGRFVSSEYMVRSDAWVFNALCCGQRVLGQGVWTSLIEPTFASMERADFSGKEAHARRSSLRLALECRRAMGRVLGSN